MANRTKNEEFEEFMDIVFEENKEPKSLMDLIARADGLKEVDISGLTVKNYVRQYMFLKRLKLYKEKGKYMVSDWIKKGSVLDVSVE